MGNFTYKKNIDELSTHSNAEIINKRRVINGEDDGLMQLSPLKHQFADTCFQQMLQNTWTPQEVSLTKDAEMWNSPKDLTEQERTIYKRSLAFVSNLDGLQTNNLINNIVKHITSPEIAIAIVRQSYEEALHVYSYATMVDTLGFDPEEIYGMYRKDRKLYEKNATVLKAINKISDPHFKTGTFETDQMFLEACIGNIILEGIYFYSAFLNFYFLRRHNKMSGSADMIQWINRDEDMHLRLFTFISNEIKKEQPELWTEDFKKMITQNFIDAVEMEYNWGISCIGGGIRELNPKNLKSYLQFVGNARLQSLGLDPIWNSKNPYPWIDEITQGSMIEVNFFEGRVKEYAVGTLEW